MNEEIEIKTKDILLVVIGLVIGLIIGALIWIPTGTEDNVVGVDSPAPVIVIGEKIIDPPEVVVKVSNRITASEATGSSDKTELEAIYSEIKTLSSRGHRRTLVHKDVSEEALEQLQIDGYIIKSSSTSYYSVRW